MRHLQLGPWWGECREELPGTSHIVSSCISGYHFQGVPFTLPPCLPHSSLTGFPASSPRTCLFARQYMPGGRKTGMFGGSCRSGIKHAWALSLTAGLGQLLLLSEPRLPHLHVHRRLRGSMRYASQGLGEHLMTGTWQVSEEWEETL